MISKKYIVVDIVGEQIVYGAYPSGLTIDYDRSVRFSSKEDAEFCAMSLWGKCIVIENWVCEE